MLVVDRMSASDHTHMKLVTSQHSDCCPLSEWSKSEAYL